MKETYYLDKEGKKYGIYETRYDSGQLWKYLNKYVHGKAEGQWKSYYKNGNPWTFTQYVNDKNHGEWINYYESGQLQAIGKYVDNKRAREWKEYFENGEPKSI